MKHIKQATLALMELKLQGYTKYIKELNIYRTIVKDITPSQLEQFKLLNGIVDCKLKVFNDRLFIDFSKTLYVRSSKC